MGTVNRHTVVLVSSVAVLLIVSQIAMLPRPGRAAPCTSPTGQTVRLVVKNPDGTQLQVTNVPWVENCTVHLAMMNAQQLNPQLTFQTAYFCPYGSFVTSLDGFQESGDHFWALYVNGSFAQLGMDTQLLKPNDEIVWQVDTMATVPQHLHASVQAKAATHRLAHCVDYVLRQTKK